MKELFYTIKYLLVSIFTKESYDYRGTVLTQASLRPINWKVWNRWYNHRTDYSKTRIKADYYGDIKQYKFSTALSAIYSDGTVSQSNIYSYSKIKVRYGTFSFRLAAYLPSDRWNVLIELSAALSSPGIYASIYHKNGNDYITAWSYTGGTTSSKITRKIDRPITRFHDYTIKWTPEYILWYIDSKLIYKTTKNIPTNKLSIRIAVDGEDTTEYKNNEEALLLISNLIVNTTWKN